MRRSTIRAAFAAAAVLLAAAGCRHPASQTAPPAPQRSAPTTATAVPVEPDPHIGALFLGATDLHICAAAVLHSATGDLIVTAAHCLSGGNDATFVPGFSGNGGPAGTWRVDAVYFDPRWLANQDAVADYAIARVSRDGDGGQERWGHLPPAGQGDDPGTNTGSLEAAVGPGLALGVAPKAGSVVTVTAYPLGTGGSPIRCRNTSGVTPSGYPSLDCVGFVGGTSGAPWLAGSSVVGVIGGLHGGGCDDNVSYSPPFDDSVARLLARAEAGDPGDVAPQSFTDEC